MRLLVGFEESGRVTEAFLNAGVDAYSCDLLPTSGNRPDRHFQADFFDVFESGCYDALICFPPCTYLSNINYLNYTDLERRKKGDIAITVVKRIYNLPVEFVAIENPVGRLSRDFCKPTQVIQPYFYGDPFSKRTCLWLRGFPLLPVLPFSPHPSWVYGPANGDSKLRSKTFPGVASAMAREWAPVLLGEKKYQGSLFFQ